MKTLAIIARQAGILLAFTFGNKNVLKAGGTSDTLGKFLQMKPAAAAHHCDLHTFKTWTHATSG